MVHLTVADPASAEARPLIAELDAYLSALYPAESNHLLSVEALRAPNVTFVLAHTGEVAAGCGAFVNHGAYAEVKRMFVRPGFRGQRIGQLILGDLERRARQAGLTIARLETGIAQPEALALYERAGYVRRGPFGDYADDPLSVFMEKSLVSRSS
jgi:putative acetyltransferase